MLQLLSVRKRGKDQIWRDVIEHLRWESSMAEAFVMFPDRGSEIEKGSPIHLRETIVTEARACSPYLSTAVALMTCVPRGILKLFHEAEQEVTLVHV